MADTYDWENDNPLINHYSGDAVQAQTLPWTPPDSSYQRNQIGGVSWGADGSNYEPTKETGGYSRIDPNNDNQALEYDDNGNLIRTAARQRSSDLSGLWQGLGTLAGIGLGGYGLMNGFGSLGSMFGGAGEGLGASIGGDAFGTIAAENAGAGLSSLAPTSVGSFGPVANVTAGGGTGGFNLGSMFGSGNLKSVGDFLKNPLFEGAPAGLTGMTGLSSVYDMYAKNKMAGEQKDRYNQINNQINGSYAPGSPEFEYMKQELARKDARAGRNSQYGPRAVELQAKVADIKNRNLASTQMGQNNLQSSYLNNEYGGLNSLFGYLNKAGATQKILGQ